MIEDFDHPAMRRYVAVRPPGDLDDDVVAVPGAMRKAGSDLDRVPVTRILRFDAAHTLHRMIDPAKLRG